MAQVRLKGFLKCRDIQKAQENMRVSELQKVWESNHWPIFPFLKGLVRSGLWLASLRSVFTWSSVPFIEFKFQVSKPLGYTCLPAVKSCVATHHLVCVHQSSLIPREKQTSTSWRPAPCFPGLSDSWAHFPFCWPYHVHVSYYVLECYIILDHKVGHDPWAGEGRLVLQWWTEGNSDTGLSPLNHSGWGQVSLTCMGGGKKSPPGRKPSKGTSKGAISGEDEKWALHHLLLHCLQCPTPPAKYHMLLPNLQSAAPTLPLPSMPSLTDPASTQLPGSGSLAITHNFILAHLPSILEPRLWRSVMSSWAWISSWRDPVLCVAERNRYTDRASVSPNTPYCCGNLQSSKVLF